MKRIIALAIILAGSLSTTGLQAASPLADSYFSRANTAYVGGENNTDTRAAEANYKMAAQLYQSAIDEGDDSWAAHFNLANTYFKLGDYGHACLNYEKAMAIDPFKPETAENLALARQAAGLTPARAESRVEEWALKIPMSWWMWACAVGGWALLASLILPPLHGGHSLSTICALVASLALFAVSGTGMTGWHLHARWQIVTTPDAPMLAAPDADASEVSKIPQGTQVHPLRRYQDWLFIQTEQDKQGWIKTDAASSVWKR